MQHSTPEQQVIANTAKRVLEDLMRVEAGLRTLATLDAAGNDAAKKVALQNTFRRQARSLATTSNVKPTFFKDRLLSFSH
jgi:hypothetical protein